MPSEYIPVLITLIIVTGIIVTCYILRDSLTLLIPKINKLKINNKKGNNEMNIDISTNEDNADTTVDDEMKNLQVDKKNPKNDNIEKVGYSDLLEAIKYKDQQKAEDLFEKIYENENSKDDKLNLKFGYYYNRYFYGIDSNFDNLESLIPDIDNVDYKAQVYKRIGDLEKEFMNNENAKDRYLQAMDIVDSPDEYVNIVNSFNSIEYKDNPEKIDLKDFFNKYYDRMTTNTSKYKFYKSLYLLLKDYNKEKALYLLEIGTQFMINDTEKLFYLAYRLDDHTKVYYYYTLILKYDKNDAAVLNNLGVVCSKLNLNINKMNYWERSSELNETLASANIGYDLANIGKLSDIETIISNAQQQDNYHSNIDELKTHIKKLKDDENKLVKKIKKYSVSKSSFIKNAGFDLLTNSIKQIIGRWKDNDSNYILEVLKEDENDFYLKLFINNELYESYVEADSDDILELSFDSDTTSKTIKAIISKKENKVIIFLEDRKFMGFSIELHKM